MTLITPDREIYVPPKPAIIRSPGLECPPRFKAPCKRGTMIQPMRRGHASGSANLLQYVGGMAAADPNGGSPDPNLGGGLSGGIATSPSVGDYVIFCAIVAEFGNESFTLSESGYTTIGSELYGQGGFYDANSVVWAKFWEGGDPTTITWSNSASASGAGGYLIMVFRGVHATEPVSVQTVEQDDTVLFDPPAITPPYPNSWILIAGCGAHSSGIDNFSQAQMTQTITCAANDSCDVSGIMGYYDGWTSGEFNPSACTFTASDSSSWGSCGYTIALRSA